MELNIRTTGVELTPWLKERIESKVSRLDRYLSGIDGAWVELKRGSGRNAQEREVVQLTLRANRIFLRAEERSDDILTSLDAVLDKMYSQIERHKGRRGRRPREEEVLPEEEAVGEEVPRIVRFKRFALIPMEEEEAIEQMELLGHDFFVFYNVNDAQVNVLYRRRDGDYGLIQPELV
jgi:putative sigma-54 modulation protein